MKCGDALALLEKAGWDRLKAASALMRRAGAGALKVHAADSKFGNFGSELVSLIDTTDQSARILSAQREFFGALELHPFGNAIGQNSVWVSLADWQAGDFEVNWPEWYCRVSGLSFDKAGILALASSGGSILPALSVGGAPQKWDWEGALAHLVAIANNPDGLIGADGEPLTQAEIARMMAHWFYDTQSKEPTDSEIRKRARKVMDAIAAYNRSKG